MITLFLVFLRNLHTIIHSGCTNYIPTNKIGEFPFFHILFRFYYLYFLMMAILTIVRWYLIVVLICISLIISDVEHFFMCLLAIIYLLWRNVYLDLLIFLIGLFDFLILSYMGCLYILEINPLSVTSFTNIFSHSVGCLFVLFMVCFAVQKWLV